MIKIYFTLIVVSLGIQAILGIAPYFDSYLTQDELNILSWRGFGAYFKYELWHYYIIQVLYVFVSIGLILFKSWARFGFIILTIATSFLTLFMGLGISIPWENMLAGIMSMIDGFLLCTMYFTSIAQKFK